MESVKQIIHDIADNLPDQATFDDAMGSMGLARILGLPSLESRV